MFTSRNCHREAFSVGGFGRFGRLVATEAGDIDDYHFPVFTPRPRICSATRASRVHRVQSECRNRHCYIFIEPVVETGVAGLVLFILTCKSRCLHPVVLTYRLQRYRVGLDYVGQRREYVLVLIVTRVIVNGEWLCNIAHGNTFNL